MVATGRADTQTKLRELARAHDIDLTRPRPVGAAIQDALVLGAANIFLDQLLTTLTPSQRDTLEHTWPSAPPPWMPWMPRGLFLHPPPRADP